MMMMKKRPLPLDLATVQLPWTGKVTGARLVLCALSLLTITNNDGDKHLLHLTTPVSIVEDEESERGSPHTSRSTSTIAIKVSDAETASRARFLPLASETKQNRFLVTPKRYRMFRANLYTLFAVIKPKARRMEFEEVIKYINKDLPAEQRFHRIEAKRVLNYMREKLLDSLCADRVVGADLAGVELYA
jgi:hypothetical protein